MDLCLTCFCPSFELRGADLLEWVRVVRRALLECECRSGDDVDRALGCPVNDCYSSWLVSCGPTGEVASFEVQGSKTWRFALVCRNR